MSAKYRIKPDVDGYALQRKSGIDWETLAIGEYQDCMLSMKNLLSSIEYFDENGIKVSP